MKGDFSRSTFKSSKHYSGVRLQQGRVLLDADFNEQGDIQAHRDHAMNKGVIGLAGGPKAIEAGNGFRITSQNGELRIGQGHYYVDGILCENDDEQLMTEQPDLPLASTSASAEYPLVDENGVLIRESSLNSGFYLAYLDVWQRLITAQEEEGIRDKALGGPDTAARTKTVWQVKLRKVSDPGNPPDIAQYCAGWTPAPKEEDRGKMAARIVGDVDSLKISNQLYRVEIHNGGPLAEATFKWSRDNASIATPLIVEDGKKKISSTGQGASGFKVNDWVEVINDDLELQGQPGVLARLKKDENQDLVIDCDILFDTSKCKVRRWDCGEINLATTENEGWLNLAGSGIEIKFEPGQYLTGDYWMIPARTLSEAIEWPEGDQAQPRNGPVHHYAALALLKRNAADFPSADIVDLRQLFPPLTDIAAEDVSFDPSATDMGEVDTVQEALEKLWQKETFHGACTHIVKPEANWETVFDKIADAESAQICFLPGIYRLQTTKKIENKGHLLLCGRGAGTRIYADKTEAAFAFHDCQSVTIRDMFVAGRPSLTVEKQLNGALTFVGCHRVELTSVALKCGEGNKPTATCVTVRPGDQGATFTASVRIHNCILTAGHRQTGILLVDVKRIHIEDNEIQAPTNLEKLNVVDMLINPTTRVYATRLMFWNASLGKSGPADEPTNALVQDGDYRVYFTTDKSMKKDWQKLYDANKPAHCTSPDDVLAAIKKLAGRVLLEKELREKYDSVNQWYKNLAKLIGNTPIPECGIAIGGKIAKDVRILHNTISGPQQGIHLGLSHGGTPTGSSDVAGVVNISGNTIELNLSPLARRKERHGIFVGNCNSLMMQDNNVKVNRIEPPKTPFIEGIRVWGVLGRMLVIRHNLLDNFNLGIRVTPINSKPSDNQTMWIVADNVATSSHACVAVQTTNGVEKNHNFPPQQLMVQP